MKGKRWEAENVIHLTWEYIQDRRYLLPLDGKHYRRRYALGQANKEGWYYSRVLKG